MKVLDKSFTGEINALFTFDFVTRHCTLLDNVTKFRESGLVINVRNVSVRNFFRDKVITLDVVIPLGSISAERASRTHFSRVLSARYNRRSFSFP